MSFFTGITTVLMAFVAACGTPAQATSPLAAPAARACGGANTVEVASAAQLTNALARATPGAVIRLAPGVYSGSFRASAAGTAEAPILLCGPRTAVLDGGSIKGGYTLHLDGAAFWQVSGFTVREGQKGVMLDRVRASLVEGLLVTGTGDEGVHLRRATTDTTVRGNEIRETGKRTAKYGEGVYVGSAQSNWCDISACGPDRSDRNTIEGNTITATTAESVDIKEGTTGGVLRGNTFNGAGMSEGDSWVDVKGNGWTIDRNAGTTAPKDGFQVHEILDGWGVDNVFTANNAVVNAAGYGFNVTKNSPRNPVRCNNTAVGAAKGLSSAPCVP